MQNKRKRGIRRKDLEERRNRTPDTQLRWRRNRRKKKKLNEMTKPSFKNTGPPLRLAAERVHG